MPDTIEIQRLELRTHIGVPDQERAAAQSLWLTLRMIPTLGFDHLADDIAKTVDYDQVATELKQLAAAKPRNLIETLAAEIAAHLLSHHPLDSVSIRIEKQILPDTDCVAVEIERHR